MTAMNKRQLRSHLRSLHEGRALRDMQSAEICRHIMNFPAYQNARIVGGYVPLSHEADITPVLLDALETGKTLALPLCGEAPHMTLRAVPSMGALVPGAYGILEPCADAPVIPVKEVDLLLVPLEGIDREGFRLGKGGGYYDCLLAGADVMTVGCALSWQRLTHLPREPWDKPLSACADMDGIHVFER